MEKVSSLPLSPHSSNTVQLETKSRPPPVKAKKKPVKLKRLPLALVLLTLAVGGWWAWRAIHATDNGAAALITGTVKRGNLTETISATGSVTAQTGAQVKIGSQITGRIKKLSADVGSQVKAGQVIAELDLPDVQAQLNQAKANLAVARTKLAQQQSGVGMQRTQASSAVLQAQAGRTSAQARLRSAQAAADLQSAQTPTDIARAKNAVASAQAARSTAQSNLSQTQAGTELQVANAQQQINQATATALNSERNLSRQKLLLEKGYVAASTVDQAQAIAAVDKSQVLAAQQSLALVQQKNTADVKAGRNQLTQAEQEVKTAQASLTAANAGPFQEAVKRAAVGDARAALAQSEANLTLARGNTAQNTLKAQDVKQAQESVRVVQQQVAYAQAQMDKTLIRSPISGTVLQLASQQGETLAAGLSSPTLIVVADLKRLQVDAYVDETDIGKVALGQSVTVTVDAFPGQSFSGRVAKIASGSTIIQAVITYDVTITLSSMEHPLKPDMTASVTIQTGTHNGVLLVPSEAIKTSTKGVTVTVLNKAKTATEARKVTLGGTDGVNTEIREGLKEGETIVLAGALKAAAGTQKSGSPFGMSGGRGGGSRSNSGPPPGGGGGPP